MKYTLFYPSDRTPLFWKGDFNKYITNCKQRSDKGIKLVHTTTQYFEKPERVLKSEMMQEVLHHPVHPVLPQQPDLLAHHKMGESFKTTFNPRHIL